MMGKLFRAGFVNVAVIAKGRFVKELQTSYDVDSMIAAHHANEFINLWNKVRPKMLDISRVIGK